MRQLVVKDKVTGEQALPTMLVAWRESVPLTARTIISERVRMEWEAQEDDRKLSKIDKPAPLVDAAMMRRANPFSDRPKSEQEPQEAPRPTTVEATIAIAIRGFVRNAFLLIVDGRQVSELDELIPFRTTSEVTFVRLVPLVGG